jgi:hypothetical protein
LEKCKECGVTEEVFNSVNIAQEYRGLNEFGLCWLCDFGNKLKNGELNGG